MGERHRIDLLIHVHFNDHPRHSTRVAGSYSGHAIYVPERQYSNSRTSRAIADTIHARIAQHYPTSDLEAEKDGIIEDQELIAIGRYNTLDPASIIIEYGYIYESQFYTHEVASIVLDDLAYQTYLGIKDALLGTVDTKVRSMTLVDSLFDSWSDLPLPRQTLSLQAALSVTGVYPPEERSKNDCPINGTFGLCTKTALAQFQEQHGIHDEHGRVGRKTAHALNTALLERNIFPE